MPIPGSRGPKFGPDAWVTQMESYQFRKQAQAPKGSLYTTLEFGIATSNLDLGALAGNLLLCLLPSPAVDIRVAVSRAMTGNSGAAGDYIRTALYEYTPQRNALQYIQNSESKFVHPGTVTTNVEVVHTPFTIRANTQLALAILSYSPLFASTWRGANATASPLRTRTQVMNAAANWPPVMTPSSFGAFSLGGVVLPQIVYMAQTIKELF
jgi:hypothetical protein